MPRKRSRTQSRKSDRPISKKSSRTTSGRKKTVALKRRSERIKSKERSKKFRELDIANKNEDENEESIKKWLDDIANNPHKLEMVIRIQRNYKRSIYAKRHLWEGNHYYNYENDEKTDEERVEPDNEMSIELALKSTLPDCCIDLLYFCRWLFVVTGLLYLIVGISLAYSVGTVELTDKCVREMPDGTDCTNITGTKSCSFFGLCCIHASDNDWIQKIPNFCEPKTEKEIKLIDFRCLGYKNLSAPLSYASHLFWGSKRIYDLKLPCIIDMVVFFKGLKISNKHDNFDKFKHSMVWELLVQPFFALLIYLFFTTILSWITCNYRCSIKKKFGQKDTDDNRYRPCPNIRKYLYSIDKETLKSTKKLEHERLNITLNIFEEDTREGIQPWHKKHQIHMRTINEGPLIGSNGCFGGKFDSLIFNCLINENKPYDKSNEIAPFLGTKPLRKFFGESTKTEHEWLKKGGKIAKQLRDQVINRLSMLFGSAYICRDQGLEISSHKYVFGITYEPSDISKGTKQKCRVLVMRLESLKRMNKLWLDDPRTFDFRNNPYAAGRVQNLSTLMRLYMKKNSSDGPDVVSSLMRLYNRHVVNNDESELITRQPSHLSLGRKLWMAKPWRDANGPIVGDLWIASSGPTFQGNHNEM